MTLATTADRRAELEDYTQREYPTHPFDNGIRRDNLEPLMLNYFAMSQAFPHLQSSAQRDEILSAVANNHDLPIDYEITAVVGNFLAWDETGGHNCVLGRGNAGLPEITDTRGGFHANILRTDLQLILGRKDIAPSYGRPTQSYLLKLADGLSAKDPLRRCATMVAFEVHAERMITALWASVAELTKLDRDRLRYFAVHVGGADPAEAYHVAMVGRMLDALVQPEDFDRFFEFFAEAYADNIEWCEAIKHVHSSPVRVVDGAGGELWHRGSCHCGRVSFVVAAPRRPAVVRCNCSICSMTGHLHLTVPEDKFRLLAGEEHLTSYRFNTKIAHHRFCSACGVKPFYRPRSHPDAISVNARCLDEGTVDGYSVSDFDGRTWDGEDDASLDRAIGIARH